jgi:hypothetical protein
MYKYIELSICGCQPEPHDDTDLVIKQWSDNAVIRLGTIVASDMISYS